MSKSVLVLYRCITNYRHKLHGLNHTYLLSHSTELQSVSPAQLSPLLRVSLDWNQGVVQGEVLMWSSGSFPKLLEIVGRILFLAVIEQKCHLIAGYRTGRGCCQFLEASFRCWPHCPLKHDSLFLQSQRETPLQPSMMDLPRCNIIKSNYPTIFIGFPNIPEEGMGTRPWGS